LLVHWCLKGIPKQHGFGDADANLVLTQGLLSKWVIHHAGNMLGPGVVSAHQALSDAALAAHVNAYGTVAATTPYISLTAGVVERDPVTRVPLRRPAWTTALDFATQSGRSDGYVFECWVPLPPNPAPELPGFGEEVRDLNLQPRFAWWHHEGEIAAKLVVPARQIRRVYKYTAALMLANVTPNPDFVPPDRIWA
jgi:hypothetical protein